MPEGYKILSSTEDSIIVSVNEKTAFTLTKDAYDLAKLAMAGGGSPEDVFAAMASVTARSAKAFDPERAAREAAKAAKLKALEVFNSTIASHRWSDKVRDLASNVVTLRQELQQIDEKPLVADLANYVKTSPSKTCQPGEYRYTMFKGIPTLVIGLTNPLPRAMVIEGEIRVAEHEFRMNAASEVKVPDVLVSENAHKHFDVDENGNIVFNVKITVRGGGNGGGGKRRKVKELSTGVVYDSKTEHGNAFNTNGAKYPHKISESRIQQGLAEYVS